VPTYLIYPLYTAVIALTLIAVVPKAEIRRQAIYAISLGGVASVVIIFLYLPIKAFSWLNMGPFGLGHVAFFPPLAWTAFFILYFYFLPRTKPWIYLFVFFASCYSTMFSNVLMNLGILQWNRGRIALPFFLYFTWFSAATWIYTKIERVERP
jgi:hypothetical protein